MAYAAVRHEVAWNEVLPLMVANVCWVIAYDTYYAMVDRADDVKIGVKSSAILFGRHDMQRGTGAIARRAKSSGRNRSSGSTA